MHRGRYRFPLPHGGVQKLLPLYGLYDLVDGGAFCQEVGDDLHSHDPLLALFGLWHAEGLVERQQTAGESGVVDSVQEPGTLCVVRHPQNGVPDGERLLPFRQGELFPLGKGDHMGAVGPDIAADVTGAEPVWFSCLGDELYRGAVGTRCVHSRSSFLLDWEQAPRPASYPILPHQLRLTRSNTLLSIKAIQP